MIYYAPYELNTTHPLNAKESALTVRGALLRTEDGVGCLQPWTSLGDDPLDIHLAKLVSGQVTPLTQRALDCCHWDGAARRAGVSLFAGKQIPRSHATLTTFPTVEKCQQLKAEGFTHIKIKLLFQSSLLDQLDTLLEAGLKLRFDCNNAVRYDIFLMVASSLSEEFKAWLDFFEDPFPYHSVRWKKYESLYGLTFALDRSDYVPDYLSVAVWKPAVQPQAYPAERTVITSNMDHAIGQMYAAARAANMGCTEVCGLLTHGLFQQDDFFAQIKSSGPAMEDPGGTGLGFDEQVERLPWKRLC
jgi:O-succinylbenzoate synthase